MTKRIFITGTGIISAMGNDTRANLASLLDSRSGIGEITLLKTILAKLPIAQVKKTTDELLEMTGQPGSRDFTRTALLGMIAAKEALESAGIHDVKAHRTGLLSATTVGGMSRSEDFYKLYLENNCKGRLRDVINHDCGDATERIADYTGITGFMTTISTACSSSANAIMTGAMMIRAGLVDRVLAGGTDGLTRFTLNGFNTLMILDKNGCRPFDDNRAGLTLGEGAAFVVLESEELARKEKKNILAEVSGFGNANDAYHQTASSPEGTGARMAMQKALMMSGLKTTDISYINVHGTGTANNDLSEGFAMEALFGDHVPPFSSTKPYTGHTLGAAGSVEAVISVLAINHGVIFPNLRFETPMKELKIRPVTQLQKNVAVNHVLSNSFGFGGNNSTLILSKVQ
ncbi:MAG: beta-ketoacyl-[acyl-carrier-protein] synthase family protein [Syntrophothermus sp.]